MEASLRSVELGGSRQWILVRGHRAKPLLLFLHGGPGAPAMAHARNFAPGIESDFLVVHWDRYGVGKSCRLADATSEFRTSREVSDAEQLIDQLLAHYGPRPVMLVGHSYGSYLGVTLAVRRPDLVSAFVGVGQVASSLHDEQQRQDAWLRSCAIVARDNRLLRALDRDAPWNRAPHVLRYGGVWTTRRDVAALAAASFGAPEYTGLDMVRTLVGMHRARRHFVWDGPTLPLVSSATRFEMPVHCFMGRHDRLTSAAGARAWFEAIDAPAKQWVDFDDSAHMPFLEEPNHFHAALRDVLQ